MQLKSLTIRRRESYESNGGQLTADAVFDGPGGTINVELAPGFIVRVLSLIEEDAAERARRLASAVQTAMIDAIDTARLVQVDAKPLAIESDVF
jgi:hypothetical protein